MTLERLRVLPPISDPSLSAQFLKTDDAKTNRGLLEQNGFDFWNQHSQISLEANFQENQKTLRVYRIFEKMPF